jgi:alpha-tubulin suppressor-like RCC1 family protein
LDDIDGNITAQIQKTCRNSAQQIVTCPTAWINLARDDYTITFSVTNSLGLSATPVTFYAKVWDIMKIAEGYSHTLALSSNGYVWAWGSGASGALGNGSTSNQLSPVQISSLSGIIDIAADDATSFAVGSNGNLYAWGDAYGNRLGIGSTTDKNTPFTIAPPAGKKYVAVSAMEENGLALTNTGEGYSWGACYYGSCGAGNSTARTVPTRINLSNIVKISAGRANGGAIDSSGNLYIWGSNYYGQLGVGASGAVSGNSHGSITGGSSGNAPQMWNDFTDVKDVCYGWAHAIVVKNNGEVWVWGNNNAYGRVGNGSTSNQYTPKQLSSISGAQSCYANENHSLVVTSSGALYIWGENSYGEVGNGATTSVTSPFQVVSSTVLRGTIGIDSAHTISTDSAIYGWGRNDAGQVGNGVTTTGPGAPWNFTIPAMVEW